MAKRDDRRRRPARGYLSVPPPAEPADDVGIRNRYNEEVRSRLLRSGTPLAGGKLAGRKNEGGPLGGHQAPGARAEPGLGHPGTDGSARAEPRRAARRAARLPAR